MGVWSDYCIICGGPYKNEGMNENDEDVVYEDCEWLNFSYSITESEEVVETELVDCGYAEADGKKFSTCPVHWGDNIYEGTKSITCHRKCYHFLKNTLGYTLKYGDVIDLIAMGSGIGVIKDHQLYGDMERYSFGQDFDSDGFLNDKWLLKDPFDNEKNGRRILKIWEPIVSKQNC